MVNESNLSFLFSLNGKDITKTDIFKLFNKELVNHNGKQEILPPMFLPTDKIKIKKGQLSNVFEDTDTTVGRYVFNLVMLDFAFGDKVPYCNKTLNGKTYGNLVQDLCDKLLMDEITGEQWELFQNRIVWFNNFSEILMAGLTTNLIVLPQPIKDELQRLITENKQCIIDNDTVAYINKIENPILKFAKEYYKLHNEPGWDIYSLGSKPKFDNVFKNMFLECGPIYDIATGKFKISTRCYSDGIDPKEYPLYGNAAISGAYNRAVNTAYSGAKTKEFTAAFQSLVVTEDDCESNETITIDVTSDKVNDIKWRWMKSNDESDSTYDKGYVLITPDKAPGLLGKTIQCRSPLFCRSDNLCWKCMGDLYRRLGLKNVGLSLSKLTSIFMNASLKSMHDATIKVKTFDPKKCFYLNGEAIDSSKVDFIEVNKDKTATFSCQYAEIELPQPYFDHGISEFVGHNVEAFGLFEIKVWNSPEIETTKPTKYFFKFKSKISMTPSSIREGRSSDGEKTEILCFNQGATFINSVDMRADAATASKMLDLATLGYVPNILPYEEIAQYWSDVNVFNGINLSRMSQTSIELIVSELCRDPKDYSRSFRKRLRDDPKFDRNNWKMINIKYISRFSSVFSSLTSGDPKGNLVSIISKTRSGVAQKDSPMEDSIL